MILCQLIDEEHNLIRFCKIEVPNIGEIILFRKKGEVNICYKVLGILHDIYNNGVVGGVATDDFYTSVIIVKEER